MPPFPRSALLVALLALPLASAVPLPERAEGIGPGTRLQIEVGGGTVACTGGWLFEDDAGRAYLGTAGHCLLPEGATATHGPGADHAASARVRACIAACDWGGQTGFLLPGNFVDLGTVAYARQRSGPTEIGHDFGLVRVPAPLQAHLRPGLPVWGTPTRAGDLLTGSPTCFYGGAVAAGESWATMARTGVGVATLDGSWRMAAPSLVGDSGAGVATCSPDGQATRAVGILTHLTAAGVAGTTMGRAEEMALEGGLRIRPVLG